MERDVTTDVGHPIYTQAAFVLTLNADQYLATDDGMTVSQPLRRGHNAEVTVYRPHRENRAERVAALNELTSLFMGEGNTCITNSQGGYTRLSPIVADVTREVIDEFETVYANVIINKHRIQELFELIYANQVELPLKEKPEVRVEKGRAPGLDAVRGDQSQRPYAQPAAERAQQ